MAVALLAAAMLVTQVPSALAKKHSGDTAPGVYVEAPQRLWDIAKVLQTEGGWAGSVSGLPAAEASATAAGSQWVGYDLETWKWSGDDRMDPLGSIKAFGTQAHADGFKVLMSVYWSNVSERFPSVPTQQLFRAQAKYGDMLVAQLPGYPQCQVQKFGKLAATVARIVAKVNPQKIMTNQLTGAGCLEEAWKAARPYAVGRWVWDWPS